jgi:hypothetical protein
MSGWLIAGLIFAGFTVWVIFFGTVVREMMRRRHHRLHGAKSFYDCAHTLGVFLGYGCGPLMWILVVTYEIADGTTRQRLHERRQESRSELTRLRSAA